MFLILKIYQTIIVLFVIQFSTSPKLIFQIDFWISRFKLTV